MHMNLLSPADSQNGLEVSLCLSVNKRSCSQKVLPLAPRVTRQLRGPLGVVLASLVVCKWLPGGCGLASWSSHASSIALSLLILQKGFVIYLCSAV
jgi:hypothetical protein